MGIYVDPKALDTLDAQKQGILYPLLGDQAGTGFVRQDFFTSTTHQVSNFQNRYQANVFNATAPASGTAWATPVGIPAGYSVGHITFTSGTTAGSVLTHQWFGLLNSSGALIVTTADDTSTAWAASAHKTLAVAKVNNATASAYTVPTPSGGTLGTPVLHWVYFLVTATTVPTLAAVTASAAIAAQAPLTGVTDQTSKTTPQATDGTIVPVITGNATVPWVGLAR